MGNKGLSHHLLQFIQGRVFGRLNRIDDVLSGDMFAPDPASCKHCGLWAQVDENRQLLAILQQCVPDLLTQYPAIEASLAHRDAFLQDLAAAADLPNPWIMSEPQGYPRPWPGVEEAPEFA